MKSYIAIVNGKQVWIEEEEESIPYMITLTTLLFITFAVVILIGIVTN